jgi:hypothetical protein
MCYDSLADAINNAPDDSTIIMLDNHTITESNIIYVNKNITLDLNGKTISKATTGTDYILQVNNNKTLTIVDN